jgi:hypothetical protein
MRRGQLRGMSPGQVIIPWPIQVGIEPRPVVPMDPGELLEPMPRRVVDSLPPACVRCMYCGRTLEHGDGPRACWSCADAKL